MAFNVTQSAEGATVKLEGSLNFSVNEDFEALIEKLKTVKKGQVVFDLSKVTQIDSVGLGLLYIAHEDLSAVGLRLSLASPSNCVSRLLELTESQKTFSITR